MFSEASVSHSVHGGRGGGSAPTVSLRGRPPPSGSRPLVLTSSGRCASYWNAFLFSSDLLKSHLTSQSHMYVEFDYCHYNQN